MDVVYLVRPGNRNDELRWSLRSLEAHLPHDRVWIVGHKPSWLTGVQHVPTRQDGHKHDNTLHNLTVACRNPDISPQFLLCNDDHFLLQPMRTVPVWHRGTLEEFIAAHRRPHKGSAMGWWQRAVETRETLRRLGHDPAQTLSYELHVPLPMVRETMLAALKELERIGRTAPQWWTKRSLYGNLAGLGGEHADDCKISTDEQWNRAGGAAAVSQWQMLSTADATFKYGRVGRWLRARFPDRCRYEKRGP